MVLRELSSERLRPFGTTIFAEMTRLAHEHAAINLSQGFPDFEGPPEVIDAVVDALRSGHNQYARSMGHLDLVHALADQRRTHFHLEYDPTTEIMVTSGATECIASSLLGLLNPGDEVILFEPFYDSYPAALAMAGAVPRYYTLRFPEFEIDANALRRLFSKKTRLLVLNSPHNPTGKVLSRAELEIVAQLCIEFDVRVLSDEVYEFLTYDGIRHLPIAALPGMRERTLSVSSAGKTFSFTGWKIGWAFGPKDMIAAAQSAHQFVTFATSTPMQVGLARALGALDRNYFPILIEEYTERRNFLVEVLRQVGLEVSIPEGTYFILARFTSVFDGTDVAFAKELVETHKVAAIPPSFFYAESPEEGRSLIRFAFCKQKQTLERAKERLLKLRIP